MRGFARSILVVDADLRFGRYIAEFFQPYGATVRVFADPASARSHVANADLVLLDLSWPQGAGVAMLDELSRADPTALGRTLVLTSLPSGELRSLLGDVPFLEKPVSVAELFDLVGLLATYPIERELSAEWRQVPLTYDAPGAAERITTARRDYAVARRLQRARRRSRREGLDKNPSSGVMQRRCLTIYGKVHNVGYRFFAARIARRSGLKGWITYRQDGTLAACVEGEWRVIDGWVEELQIGLRHSNVAKIEEVVSEFVGDLADFRVIF